MKFEGDRMLQTLDLIQFKVCLMVAVLSRNEIKPNQLQRKGPSVQSSLYQGVEEREMRV